MQGTITGKTPGERQYQMQCGDVLVNLPMADFTGLICRRSRHTTAPRARWQHTPAGASARSKTNRQIVEDEALLEMAATMKLMACCSPCWCAACPPTACKTRLKTIPSTPHTRSSRANAALWPRASQGCAAARTHRNADNSNAVVMQSPKTQSKATSTH